MQSYAAAAFILALKTNDFCSALAPAWCHLLLFRKCTRSEHIMYYVFVWVWMLERNIIRSSNNVLVCYAREIRTESPSNSTRRPWCEHSRAKHTKRNWNFTPDKIVVHALLLCTHTHIACIDERTHCVSDVASYASLWSARALSVSLFQSAATVVARPSPASMVKWSLSIVAVTSVDAIHPSMHFVQFVRLIVSRLERWLKVIVSCVCVCVRRSVGSVRMWMTKLTTILVACIAFCISKF